MIRVHPANWRSIAPALHRVRGFFGKPKQTHKQTQKIKSRQQCHAHRAAHVHRFRHLLAARILAHAAVPQRLEEQLVREHVDRQLLVAKAVHARRARAARRAHLRTRCDIFFVSHDIVDDAAGGARAQLTQSVLCSLGRAASALRCDKAATHLLAYAPMSQSHHSGAVLTMGFSQVHVRRCADAHLERDCADGLRHGHHELPQVGVAGAVDEVLLQRVT